MVQKLNINDYNKRNPRKYKLLLYKSKKKIIIPNGHIYGGTIVNYSAKPTRRIDLVIGVGYDADLKEAKAVLKSVLDKETRLFLDDVASSDFFT